jgi:valyl-tRNA synthetase
MDTWATSSLTPQIVVRLGDDPDLCERTFPMDLRRRRTTSFGRGCLDGAALAARDGLAAVVNAAISGGVLDPDRKKMSKVEGNVVTPMGCSRSTVPMRRYWAANGRPGVDTAFDPARWKSGARLAIKLPERVEVRARACRRRRSAGHARPSGRRHV